MNKKRDNNTNWPENSNSNNSESDEQKVVCSVPVL